MCRSPHYSLQGDLAIYNPETRLSMFESGPLDATSCVIFVGGLQDSFNGLPYLKLLGDKLANELGFSLVQVMLSSGYMGYGTSSLLQDVKELDILIHFLREKRNKERFFLLGHSTGCQDAIYYALHGKYPHLVDGLILQGPVSDREYMASTMDNYSKYLTLAQAMIQDGRGQELLPRDADVAPMSAYRFNSLGSVGGDDDMFSSDTPAETLQALYNKVDIPLVMVHSGRDEYIPAHVDKDALVQKLSAACPTCQEAVVLPDADHAISDPCLQTVFCEGLISFLKDFSSAPSGA
ncbi:hypothetical protein DFQ26_002647 [Actinomortierella ambigua]|nr:hypothetical protein DFQ26_002647 [Actinomortierella ambigua]